MGYKNKDKKREYQKQWIADKRKQFFIGKSCVKCGSTDNLEFDHIDRNQKTFNVGRFLSYSFDKINEEVKKCRNFMS